MDNTVYLIGRVKNAMNEFIISELEHLGIDGIVPSHGDIIMELFRNETLSMSELAERIDKDPSTITTLVKKLSSIGYTQVFKDDKDRRANKVSLTSQGKALEAIFKSVSEKVYEKQYYNIERKDKEVFRAVLEKMIENFSKKDKRLK